MTKGEYRVGVDFNPSGNEIVSQIKAHAAGLIDMIEDIDDHGDGEIMRLKALAQTVIEEGAMWAVKAATKKTAPARPLIHGGDEPAGAPV